MVGWEGIRVREIWEKMCEKLLTVLPPGLRAQQPMSLE